MSKFTIVLILLLPLLLFSTSIASNQDLAIKKKTIKIFTINSYTMNYSCTAPQVAGIAQYLNKFRSKFYKLERRSIYMDAKTNYIEEYERKYIAKKIIKEIKRFDPDYIITTDDAAFQYIGIPLSNEYKIFASGLNVPIEIYQIKYPKINLSNMILVPEYTILDNFMKIIEQSKIRPEHWTILYSDDDTSYYMMKNYEKELKKFNITFNTIKVDNYQQLKEILKYNNKPGIYLVALQIIDGFQQGCSLNKEEFAKLFLLYNSNSIEITINPVFSKFGYSMAIGPDFRDMGNLIGKELINIIQKKKEFKHKIFNGSMKIAVNTKRLHDLDYEELISRSFDMFDIIYRGYNVSK